MPPQSVFTGHTGRHIKENESTMRFHVEFAIRLSFRDDSRNIAHLEPDRTVVGGERDGRFGEHQQRGIIFRIEFTSEEMMQKRRFSDTIVPE